jgi:hypothetical protein
MLTWSVSKNLRLHIKKNQKSEDLFKLTILWNGHPCPSLY